MDGDEVDAKHHRNRLYRPHNQNKTAECFYEHSAVLQYFNY